MPAGGAARDHRCMTTPVGWLLRIVFSCAAALLAAFAVLLATQTSVHPAAASYSQAGIGGLRYSAVLGRPVDPSNPVDASIIRGASPHLSHGQILFGAFVTVTNHSGRALPTATRIDLRDDGGHTYLPIHLPASNRYAYTPRTLAPGTKMPRDDAAVHNLAAGGRLLLYRVPAARYSDGIFELVVHDPLHAGVTGYVEF
jgi:hypothetical protein